MTGEHAAGEFDIEHVLTWVLLHGGWMVVAVAVGTAAGYLGLVRATAGEGGRSPFPGRFRPQLHAALGAAYYLMLYAGMVGGWAMHEFLFGGGHLFPRTVARLHIALALAIAVLYGVAWVLGAGLRRRPAGARRLWPRLHMVANYTACTLVAVQMVVAIYYVALLM